MVLKTELFAPKVFQPLKLPDSKPGLTRIFVWAAVLSESAATRAGATTNHLLWLNQERTDDVFILRIGFYRHFMGWCVRKPARNPPVFRRGTPCSCQDCRRSRPRQPDS